MFTTIKKFCEDNSADNGLLLIDSPTGSGKTHSVLDFIYYASLDERFQDRKIFFVTTQKKNLPKDELKERYRREGHLDKFEEKFLFIDSNLNSIIDGFDENVDKAIPDELKKIDEYKRFVDAVPYRRRDKRYCLDEDVSEAGICRLLPCRQFEETVRSTDA